jgi:hypothetical protein
MRLSIGFASLGASCLGLRKSMGAWTPRFCRCCGTRVLVEVIRTMPNSRVLLLQGEQAKWAFAMAQAFVPELPDPWFLVVPTCHPLGTRGATSADTRAKRHTQEGAWRRAAEHAIG